MTSVRSYTRLHRHALLVVALSTVACSAATEPRTAPGQLASLPRDLTPAEQKLIGASNAFSFALWNKVSVAQRDSNVFISPLSASFALGMILNGAANETFDQMRTALQVEGVSQADIDAGYKSLVALLTSLDPGVTMQIANSVWYRQGFSVNQSFIDAVSTYFDANAQALDFSDPASLTTINSWVSRKTNGKITTILDRISSDDVMFLINALYFKGSWRQQFDPAETTDGTFTSASGVGQPVRLMHRRNRMLYAESPTYKAVDLPYGNGAFTMTLVLPAPTVDIETLSAGVDQSNWRTLTSSFDSAEVDLSLPKFQLTYQRLLNSDLNALGMIVPFQGGLADFTRMSPMGKQLFLSFVTQKTFVDVNEEGTEAAAVTVGGISLTSVPSYKTFQVDRPFLFIIRERLSGTVLFMGKVVRMSAP